MIMRKSLTLWIAIILAATTLASCSLLKVSVSTGEPLSKHDANARVMTRGFYYELSTDITQTADSIVSLTPEVEYQVRVIKWKIRATKAALAAAMQSIPEVALADLWILCNRSTEALNQAPDSMLFGEYSYMAREVTTRLDSKVLELADNVLSAERLKLMKNFVGEYMETNKVSNGEEVASNTTYAWLNYLKVNGIVTANSTGSIAEVMADMSDKVDGQTKQISKTIGWSKDILDIRMQQDSTKSQLQSQLRELENNFDRMVVVMENIPAISDTIVENLNTQIHKLIYTMNYSVDNAFISIDQQRDSIQKFISLEREMLIKDGTIAANDAISTALDALPALVGKIVLYIIILGVVMLGVPFAIGFWAGGLRQRVKSKKGKGSEL